MSTAELVKRIFEFEEGEVPRNCRAASRKRGSYAYKKLLGSAFRYN